MTTSIVALFVLIPLIVGILAWLVHDYREWCKTGEAILNEIEWKARRRSD